MTSSRKYMNTTMNGKMKKKNEEDEEEHHEYEHVEYKPERNMFYYVFDHSGNLIKGEETVSGFAQYLYRKNLHSQSGEFMKDVEWKKAHVLFIGYPLQEDHKIFGSVIIGMDITDE